MVAKSPVEVIQKLLNVPRGMAEKLVLSTLFEKIIFGPINFPTFGYLQFSRDSANFPGEFL